MDLYLFVELVQTEKYFIKIDDVFHSRCIYLIIIIIIIVYYYYCVTYIV